MTRTIAFITGVAFLFLLLIVAVGCQPAQAAKGFHSARPQGFRGIGHEKWHDVYVKLRRDDGSSCCSGNECRPTQARYDAASGQWQIMVDAIWRDINPHNIITDYGLAQRGLDRSDLSAEAHVCAAPRGTLLDDGTRYPGIIHCIVLPEPDG